MKWYLIAAMVAAGLVVLAGIAALVVVLIRRRSRRKTLADQLSCKLREEALDRALANSRGASGIHGDPAPVEVRFNLTADRRGAGALVRLTEHNLTATRVYLVDRGQRLFLGVKDGRAVVRRDYDAHSGVLCELYARQDGQCLRSLAPGVQLQRGRTVAAVGTDGQPLATGDEILLPDTAFHVELI